MIVITKNKILNSDEILVEIVVALSNVKQNLISKFEINCLEDVMDISVVVNRAVLGQFVDRDQFYGIGGMFGVEHLANNSVEIKHTVSLRMWEQDQADQYEASLLYSW